MSSSSFCFVFFQKTITKKCCFSSFLFCRANLSSDYFSNRQDRYIEFLYHPSLSDYFSSLIKTVSSYSFKVTATDTTTLHPSLSITWPTTNSISNPLLPTTEIEEFKSSAQTSFLSLTKLWASKPPSSLTSTLPHSTYSSSQYSPYDTTLHPVLQMGPFNILQETDLVVPAIFRTANSLATAPGGGKTLIDWTSGYFSVQKNYLEKVLDSKAIVRIVTASPEVGFFFFPFSSKRY